MGERFVSGIGESGGAKLTIPMTFSFHIITTKILYIFM